MVQEALALSQQQEITRQQEQMVKVKEYEASIEQMKIEGKRVEGEQRRKFLEEEAKQVGSHSHSGILSFIPSFFYIPKIGICKNLIF